MPENLYQKVDPNGNERLMLGARAPAPAMMGTEPLAVASGIMPNPLKKADIIVRERDKQAGFKKRIVS